MGARSCGSMSQTSWRPLTHPALCVLAGPWRRPDLPAGGARRVGAGGVGGRLDDRSRRPRRGRRWPTTGAPCGSIRRPRRPIRRLSPCAGDWATGLGSTPPCATTGRPWAHPRPSPPQGSPTDPGAGCRPASRRDRRSARRGHRPPGGRAQARRPPPALGRPPAASHPLPSPFELADLLHAAYRQDQGGGRLALTSPPGRSGRTTSAVTMRPARRCWGCGGSGSHGTRGGTPSTPKTGWTQSSSSLSRGDEAVPGHLAPPPLLPEVLGRKTPRRDGGQAQEAKSEQEEPPRSGRTSGADEWTLTVTITLSCPPSLSLSRGRPGAESPRAWSPSWTGAAT